MLSQFLKFFFLSICVLQAFSFDSKAVIFQRSESENEIYVTPDDPMADTIAHLMLPDQYPVDPENDPYVNANQILLLGEGSRIGGDDLVNEVQELAPPDATIYRTVDYPISPFSESNVIFKSLDHQDFWDFNSNQFDVIVMRRGLCICNPGYKTCGGITVKSKKLKRLGMNSDEGAFRFISEIVRVLNKKKQEKFAWLDGSHSNRWPKYQRKTLQVWNQVLTVFSKAYHELDFKLVHMIAPPQVTSLGANLDEKKRMENGTSSHYKFRGIYIGSKLRVQRFRTQDR